METVRSLTLDLIHEDHLLSLLIGFLKKRSLLSFGIDKNLPFTLVFIFKKLYKSDYSRLIFLDIEIYQQSFQLQNHVFLKRLVDIL